MEDNNTIESCNCDVIHEEIVNKVKETMPEEEMLYMIWQNF